MNFDTKYDRRISLEQDGPNLMLGTEELDMDEERVYSVLNPEEAYKIHDWIAENIKRPEQPKNAREIIDALPVGNTFTLRHPEGDVPPNYYRKVDENTVQQYDDEHMTSHRGLPWSLVDGAYGKNLFTSWSVESYAEFEPVEKPLSIQHWEQMPVGAMFGFGKGGIGPREGWYFPYTKRDERNYGSPTSWRDIYTDTTPNDRARGLFWRVGDGYTYGPEAE